MNERSAVRGLPALGRGRWARWFRSWERQQESFNPVREARFEAMLDLVEVSVPRRFTAIDLGCGPGSLSYRLLRRFPQARCVAVDFDPVVLRIGREALGTVDGRLAWHEADLRSTTWGRGLPARPFDVAVSTTALHWLDARALRRLYRTLAPRLRRGAIFLNGDHLPWGPEAPTLARLAERVRRLRTGGAARSAGWRAWEAWWKAAEQDPVLGPLFAERTRRQSHHPRHGDEPLSVHRDALRRASFSDVEVVWRGLENGILFARR